MGWVYAIGFFAPVAGSLAAGYIGLRSMRMLDIAVADIRPHQYPSMFPVYIAVFVVFVTKGLMAAPLASLLRDPSGDGAVEAVRSMAFGGLALDASWMTIAVAAPVVEMNRQWMITLRGDIKGFRVPFVVRLAGWVPAVGAVTFGFWLHVELTGQQPVVAWAYLVLSLLAMDLLVRGGVTRAMDVYLNVRQKVIDTLKERLEGAPADNRAPALPQGAKRTMRIRWAVFIVAAGVAGYLTTVADAATQLLANAGPIVMVMLLGTTIDVVKTGLENRAEAALKKTRR